MFDVIAARRYSSAHPRRTLGYWRLVVAIEVEVIGEGGRGEVLRVGRDGGKTVEVDWGDLVAGRWWKVCWVVSAHIVRGIG